MKWAYPMKGRTMTQALADIFDVDDSDIWRNPNQSWVGGASWGVENSPLAPQLRPMDYKRRQDLYCFHSMKECLRMGFIIDGLCILPKDPR